MPRKFPPFVERWRVGTERCGTIPQRERCSISASLVQRRRSSKRPIKLLLWGNCSEAMCRARSHRSNSFSGYENSSSSAVLNS